MNTQFINDTKEMFPRTYGSRYQKDLTAKDVAKLIRAEIKRLTKLGEIPTGKYSVTTERYSSIRIRIGELDGVQLYTDGYAQAIATGTEREYYPRSGYSDELKRVKDLIESFGKSFRYDGSDAMYDHFDTNFYVFCDINWEWSHREICSIKERFKAGLPLNA
jgi:hypothetical protein